MQRRLSRQFAERLYDELWEGKTDLLCKEVYDVEKKVLKETLFVGLFVGRSAASGDICAHAWRRRTSTPS